MFYIIEHQLRPDGTINVVPEVSRQTLATALSYYYDRMSKMVVTDLYVKVSLMLTDELLGVRLHDVVDTLYVPPNDGTDD